MDRTEIAIIGDHFMLPDTFEAALGQVLDPLTLSVRKLTLPWPDEPMTISDGEIGVGEYVGDPDEVARFVSDASVLINHLAPVTAGMLDRVPNLRLVAISRGGPVNLDIKALRVKGVKVANTPGRNASAVAEFTVGMVIAHTRRIMQGHESLRKGNWRSDLYRFDNTGDELADLTVGLLGYGRVGRLLATMLRPFDCRLLVHDPFVKVEEDWMAQVCKEELLGESDVVTINARVTPETVGMIGKHELEMMRPSSLLVNVARGPLVDYGSLADALRNGQIGAAAIDTFPQEPPPADWELLGMPNVIVTPHMAGASRRTTMVAAANAAEEVRRHLAGEPPLNPC